MDDFEIRTRRRQTERAMAKARWKRLPRREQLIERTWQVLIIGLVLLGVGRWLTYEPKATPYPSSGVECRYVGDYAFLCK